MKIENTRLIRAQPATVWNALNDIEVLRRAIPGCREMEQTGDHEYALTINAKVGPLSAMFKGRLGVQDIVEGRSYTLHFDGQGGAAGFGKGSAAVRLEPAADGTHLHYTVDARVGGRIAQIGQRLVDGAANKMAHEFFGNFEQIVAAAEPGAAPRPAPAAEGAPASRRLLWLGALLIVVLLILWLLNRG